MFAYCNNNPSNYLDKTGHEPVAIIIGLVVAIIGFVGGALAIGAHQTAKPTYSENSPSSKNGNKKPKNIPSWKKMNLEIDHITSGHMPDGPRNPDGKKSVFYGVTASQLIKLIHEAYNHSSKVATVGDRIKLRGYSSTFNIVVEIWINIKEYVIESAYPKG